MMIYVRYFFVGLAILFIQITMVPLISIEKIAPDLVIIFVVYMALRNGQIVGTVAGFISGLLMDLTVDFVPGLSALSKTVFGFISGYFYSEAKIEANIGTLRFFGIVILCSAVDNLVYFLLDILGSNFDGVEVLRLIVGRSVYTGIMSLIPVFTLSRKKGFGYE
ncbi:rod shape-determining protein MreD [Candidatus Kryptonium thompsonii]|nr:rod shape-determining protein MreD [Candidatus Kryptonium thompsoni]